MKPLRIAFLTDYLGTLAGTEAALVATAAALVGRGHAVTVLAFPREEPVHSYWREALDTAGVELHAGGNGEGAEATFCTEAAARLRRWRPDVVHAMPGGVLATRWTAEGRLPGVPVVATENSEASPRCFWYDPASFPALGGLAAIMAPCESVRAGVRGYMGYAGPVPVVPHVIPVPPSELRPLDETDLARLPRLGAITRLRVEKGPDFLIAALALVRHERADATLTVYGETPELERTLLVARGLGVEDALEVAGPFRDTAEIGGVVRRHCLFLLSSLFESLPMSLLHCAARGRPTVASDVGGVREFVRRAHAGAAVPPGDPRALADAVLVRFADPAGVLAESRRAVRYFRRAHHSDVVLPRLERVYRRVIARAQVSGETA
jgi:glycosyltransferase involved in cell wall biosynthesis